MYSAGRFSCWDRRLPAGQQISGFRFGGTGNAAVGTIVAGDNFVCASSNPGSTGAELHCTNFTTPTASPELHLVYDATPGASAGSNSMGKSEYFLHENRSVMCGGYRTLSNNPVYLFCYHGTAGIQVRSTDRALAGAANQQFAIGVGDRVIYLGIDDTLSEDRIASMDINTGTTQLAGLSSGGSPLTGDVSSVQLARGPGGTAVISCEISSNKYMFVWDGVSASATEITGDVGQLDDRYEPVHYAPGKAAIFAKVVSGGVRTTRIIIVDTQGANSPSSPGFSLLPAVTGVTDPDVRAVGPFQTPLGTTGFFALYNNELKPYVWLGDDQAAPAAVDGTSAGSTNKIFARYLKNPGSGVQAGEDVAAVFPSDVPQVVGTSTALVQHMPPFDGTTNRQAISTSNTTFSSVPQFYVAAGGKQCAILRYGGSNVNPGCFDAQGSIEFAVDMPAHPVEARMNLGADVFDPAKTITN